MLSIQEEYLERASQQLAKEIDFGVLCSFLEELGWRKVILRPMTMEDSSAVDEWTRQHVKGPFETMGLVWIFEQEQDANWFTLRWL